MYKSAAVAHTDWGRFMFVYHIIDSVLQVSYLKQFIVSFFWSIKSCCMTQASMVKPCKFTINGKKTALFDCFFNLLKTLLEICREMTEQVLFQTSQGYI